MSHVHIQRLVLIEEEFQAVQTALARALADTSLSHYAQMVRAQQNLETTYVTRLFSEFEGILKEYLIAQFPKRRPPKDAYSRINRIASVASIPDATRDDVQDAREYRNSVIHPGGIVRSAISFSTARSILSKFLAPLL